MNLKEFDLCLFFLFLFIMFSLFGFLCRFVSVMTSKKKKESDSSFISENNLSLSYDYYFVVFYHKGSESYTLENYGFDDFYELKEFFDTHIIDHYSNSIWSGVDFLCMVFDTNTHEFSSFLATSLTLEQKFYENFESFRRFFSEL